MLSQLVSIEGKLHEHMHFLGFLADDKFPIISWRQLIKSEETHVGEDLV